MYKKSFNVVNTYDTIEGSNMLFAKLVKDVVDVIAKGDKIINSYELQLLVSDIEENSNNEKVINPLYIEIQENGIARIADCSNHSSFGNLLRFLEDIYEMRILMDDALYDYFRYKFSKLYKESFEITDVTYSYDTDEINNFLELRRIGYKIISINVSGNKDVGIYKKMLIKSNESIEVNEALEKYTQPESVKEDNVKKPTIENRRLTSEALISDTVDDIVMLLKQNCTSHGVICQKAFDDGFMLALKRMLTTISYESLNRTIEEHNFASPISKLNYLLTRFKSKYRLLSNAESMWEITDVETYEEVMRKLAIAVSTPVGEPKKEELKHTKSVKEIFDNWMAEEMPLFQKDNNTPLDYNDINQIFYRMNVLIMNVQRMRDDTDIPSKPEEMSHLEYINLVLESVNSGYRLIKCYKPKGWAISKM